MEQTYTKIIKKSKVMGQLQLDFKRFGDILTNYGIEEYTSRFGEHA